METCPSYALRVAKSTRQSRAAQSFSWKTQTMSFFVDTAPSYVAAAKVNSRRIVDNACVSAFMMTITIYALCADDARLLTTDQPADNIFGVIALVCIVLFSVEIMLSCLGKPDYFLGFFFVLDIVSTATLVLDLPWVINDLAASSDQSAEVKRGRSARIGAKAARFVRVLRLVRIFKLYKVMQERRERAQKDANNVGSRSSQSPGEDEGPMQVVSGEEHINDESRVGRKLSEMMTRRVIILVLTMLVGVQMLTVEESLLLSHSATFGADEVWHAFLNLQGCGLPDSVQNATCEIKRLNYENTMLRFWYYHNWFARHTNSFPQDKISPGDYYSSLFLVGVNGKSSEVREKQAQLARLRLSTVEKFNSVNAQEQTMFMYGTMPQSALTLLSAEWGTTCGGNILGTSILAELIPNAVTYKVKCPQDLRPAERAFYFPQRQLKSSHNDDFHIEFWFDKRNYVHEDAAHSLGMTLFVCVCLLGAAVVFHNDVNQLVLYPVEAMISRVQKIQHDPVQAIKGFRMEEEKQALKSPVADGTLNSMDGCETVTWRRRLRVWGEGFLRFFGCGRGTPAEPMETLILERTIIKLGSLLVLGFGEAGANIVTQNMRGSATAGVGMVAGVRVEAVFGNIRIREFGVLTEVLQSQVMTFVNQVAEIVHGVVDEYMGAPNKNAGDNFMCIWKTTGMDEPMTSRTADFSVIAMARIVGAVFQAPMLKQYRVHPGLQCRLPLEDRVKVTTGLHYGWAIEGAVGSEFKIDASYLSPNVSIAYSVEDATSIYNVAVLISESVVNRCGSGMKKICRLIDKVWMTGSKDPYQLFTVDLCTQDMEAQDHRWRRPVVWTTRHRYKAKQFLDAEKRRKRAPQEGSYNFFKNDDTIQQMRQKHTVEFRQLFSMGYHNFCEGEWTVAKAFLQICQKNLGFTDGPSKALLEFIVYHKSEPPEDWSGIRDLEEARRIRTSADAALTCMELGEPTATHDTGDTGGEGHATSRSIGRRVMNVVRAHKAVHIRSQHKRASATDVTAPREDGWQDGGLEGGDGTGGTGSRRGSPVLDEQPVQELVDRIRNRLDPFHGQPPTRGDYKRRPSSRSNNSQTISQSNDSQTISQSLPQRGLQVRSSTSTISQKGAAEDRSNSRSSKAKRSFAPADKLPREDHAKGETVDSPSPGPRRPPPVSTGATGDEATTAAKPPIKPRVPRKEVTATVFRPANEKAANGGRASSRTNGDNKSSPRAARA